MVRKVALSDALIHVGGAKGTGGSQEAVASESNAKQAKSRIKQSIE